MEIDQERLSNTFNKIQKICEGFENYENCDEDHYTEALNILNGITNTIKSLSMFSPNEEFSEIKTEHLKFCLVPFYFGDVYGRCMTNRKEKVLKSNVN